MTHVHAALANSKEKRCVETNYHLDVTCLPALVVPAALSTTALQGTFLQVYLTRVTGSLQAPKVPWTSLLVPCRHLCVHLADNFVHFAGTVQGKSWRHIVGHLVRHLGGTLLGMLLEAPLLFPL